MIVHHIFSRQITECLFKGFVSGYHDSVVLLNKHLWETSPHPCKAMCIFHEKIEVWLDVRNWITFMHDIISVFTKDMQVKSVNDKKERLLLNFTFLFPKKWFSNRKCMFKTKLYFNIVQRIYIKYNTHWIMTYTTPAHSKHKQPYVI